MTRATKATIPLATAILSMALIQACPSSKKKSRDQPLPGHLVDTNATAYFKRSTDKKSAQLTFRTTEESSCLVKYWVTDNSEPPKQQDPATLPCPGDKPASKFDLTIQPLNPDKLYTISIYTWTKEEVPESRSPFTFEELQSATTTLGRGEASKLLFVAVTDLSLKTSSVYLHEAAEKMTKEAAEQAISYEEGCREGSPTKPPFENQQSLDHEIESISTRGFAAGSGKTHQFDKSRIAIEYTASHQTGDLWEWNFTRHNDSYTFMAQGPSVLESAKIETDRGSRSLASPKMEKELPEISSGSSEDIKLTWTSTGQRQHASLQVEIKAIDGTGTGVTCHFKASVGQGVIPASSLQSLKTGDFHLQVKLVSHLVHKYDQEKTPLWLLRGTDWRAARLKRI